MKAAPEQTQFKSIANGSETEAVGIEDNDLTVLHGAVEEAFSKKNKKLVTDFLQELRGVLDGDNELAEYVNGQRDKLGNTALHTCCMLYEQEMQNITSVFANTRDIINNEQDQKELGNQYIKMAVFAAMTKHSLIEAGLDQDIRNLRGQTAIELVTRQNRDCLLQAEEAVMEDLQKSVANSNNASSITNSPTVPSSQHVARLENEPKRHRCAIL